MDSVPKNNRIEISIKGLTDEEREEVAQIFHDQEFDAEVFQYIEKSGLPEVYEVIKLIFTDFSLWGWLRDGLLWGAFTKSLTKLWDYLKKKKPDARIERIIKYEKVTVVLPMDESDTKTMLEKLPEALKDVEPKGSKMVWVSYEKGEIVVKEW